VTRKAKAVDLEAMLTKGERFEVRRNGVVLAATDYPSCYPDRERRDQLRAAGYKLYLGGKVYREDKAK